jgi:hypothetical protein
MPSAEPRHFQRDRSLSADIADQFGGGAGNAEDLIEANALTRTSEFVAAQLLPGESGLKPENRRRPDLYDEDGKLTIDSDAVAKAAGLDADSLVSFDVHGDYLVYAYETPDERIHKDTLVIGDDGKLENPYEGKESPARAAVKAQVEAAGKLSEARSEAQKILAKAQEEADKIKREAAEEAEQERAKAVSEASSRAASQDYPEQPGNPRTPKAKQRKTGGKSKS